MKPYQQRVIIEKDELDEKLANLDAFGCSTVFDSLSTEEQEMLMVQYSLMEKYSAILGERIAAFQRTNINNIKGEAE